MASFTDTLRDKWDGISPRERRLVVILMVALPITLLVLLGSRINNGLDAIEARNVRTRRALVTVEDLHALGASATTPQASDPLALIPDEPIDLESYLNSAAEKIGLTIPSFNRQQPVKKNGFVTTSIRVDLRDLTVPQLTEFLTAIETNSKAVAVTSLTVTRNFKDKEKVDLKIDVAAYAHEPKAADGSGSADQGNG